MAGASQAVRLVVVGAGLIGQRHIHRVLASEDAELLAIVDPSDNARDMAKQAKTTWYADLDAMLAAEQPDGIVVATPNQLHVEHGLACIAAGIPALIEKPIAHDLEGGIQLVDASEKTGVPLLVGHHRRHNPLVQRAREAITSGSIGRMDTCRTGQRRGAAKQLNEEPEEKVKYCRDLEEEREKDDRK